MAFIAHGDSGYLGILWRRVSKHDASLNFHLEEARENDCNLDVTSGIYRASHLVTRTAQYENVDSSEDATAITGVNKQASLAFTEALTVKNLKFHQTCEMSAGGILQWVFLSDKKALEKADAKIMGNENLLGLELQANDLRR